MTDLKAIDKILTANLKKTHPKAHTLLIEDRVSRSENLHFVRLDKHKRYEKI